MTILYLSALIAVVLLLLALLVWAGFRLSGRRAGRRILKATLITYLIFLPVFVFGISPLLFSRMISRASTRSQDLALVDTPETYGCKFADVSFTTSDGIRLKGWLLPGSPDKSPVVMTHGLFRDRREVLQRACRLNLAAYPVLLFDLRSHGSSEADVITLGFRERLDVQAATSFARAELDRPEVNLLGVSMGAVAALLAAGENPDQVNAVVADSPFLSLHTTVRRHTSLFLQLPSFPFAHIFVWNLTRLGDFEADQMDFRKGAESLSTVPILLIYGRNDPRMPEAAARELYQVLPQRQTQLVFFENAGHGHAFASDPEGYIRLVLEFLARHQERGLVSDGPQETEVSK